MPKLVSAVPKYRRKMKPNGPQAVVTINGKDHYLGPYGSKVSKKLYDQIVLEWLAAGRQPVRQETTSNEITVAELINDYRKWAFKHYRHADGSQTGTAEQMKALMKRLRSLYGDTPVSEFRPLAFKALIQKMIQDNVSRSHINSCIARIKHMFRWGVAEELVSHEILKTLECVKGESRGRSDARESQPVPPVADSIVEATLPHMPKVVQAMVQLQRLTGMRPGEVCILRPCDIEQLDSQWFYKPQRHKTEQHGIARVVVIGPEARAVVEPYLNREPQTFCFCPRESLDIQIKAKSARRVTPMNQGNKPKRNRKPHGGECYTNDSYRRAIHRACDKAFPAPEGIDQAAKKKWHSDRRWSPNQLRHSAATEIRKRFGIEAVAAVLGHTRLNTSEVYAERNLSLAANVMKEIG